MATSWVSLRMNEFLGVASFAGALILLIALTSYDAADPVWWFKTAGPESIQNFVGPVGAFLAEMSYQTLGYASYLIPVLLVKIGWHSFWCETVDAGYTKLVGAFLFILCIASLLSLGSGPTDFSTTAIQPGGLAGGWLAQALVQGLNKTGSIIIILTLIFLAVILSTQFSFGRAFSRLSNLVIAGLQSFRLHIAERVAREQRAQKRRTVVSKQEESLLGDIDPRADELSPEPQKKKVKKSKSVEEDRDVDFEEPSAPQIQRPPTEPEGHVVLKPPPRNVEPRNGEYSHPPAALLDASQNEHKIDERELMERASLLGDKCREFNVEGEVVQIHPGPVVTTYEFKPDAGVKYSKITSLSEDLCLAMQAESVLIDRIPGKATVGIQIPNQTREIISLRELLESEIYQSSKSKLSLTLGKTIHGKPFITDLASMPHLLIAGSTGAGKSVAINSMITSILYRATPSEVRMIMIDPKRLELGMYEGIPHLLTPVVVDPKLASNALRWAVHEMEERYKLLAAHGVRNIDQYNRNVRQTASELTPKDRENADSEEPLEELPYIVVVIDELADLMMVASNEVEESIARLAQMARAVGIHLILATQRPSVDVITGLIKANLPARISFRVSSKTDSRTILDTNGAEQLLGAGDMLYLPPASSRVIRLHGPYISEQENARVASFLRKQASPVYNDQITSEEKPEGPQFERDDLYDQAARIVVSTGQASISYLQRKLRVGFSRAARLIDMMEAEGLVSSGGGGKARDVLVGKDYFEEVDSQLR